MDLSEMGTEPARGSAFSNNLMGRDREFESGPLHRRVQCEPDFRRGSLIGPPCADAKIGITAVFHSWGSIRSKGCLSNKTALAMVFKFVEGAQKSWRR